MQMMGRETKDIVAEECVDVELLSQHRCLPEFKECGKLKPLSQMWLKLAVLPRKTATGSDS